MKCNTATFFQLLHCNRDRQMLRSATGSVKNSMKAKVESACVIVSVLLVLLTTIVNPYTSFGIAAILLIAPAIYKFMEIHEREGGYLND